jgi:transcriptional regulator with XRE-family HTH domain
MQSDLPISGFHPETFLARVAERRRLLGIRSDRALAIGVGLSAGYLRNIRNRQASPNADGLTRLADRLGCSVDWLLGRDATLPAPEGAVTVQPPGD